MSHIRLHRYIAIVVLFIILTYGILKPWVLDFYTSAIIQFFNLFNLNINELKEFLINNSKNKWNENKVGWLIYYPTYYLLHVIFIYSLFKKNISARNLLIIGLSGLIGVLLVCIILGKIYEIGYLYDISWNLFRSLFGLPFILLAIEGGRILYRDFEKRIREIEN